MTQDSRNRVFEYYVMAGPLDAVLVALIFLLFSQQRAVPVQSTLRVQEPFFSRGAPTSSFSIP